MKGLGEETNTSWTEIARRVGGHLPLKILDAEAVSFLQDSKENVSWLLTCSGGADSVMLLLLTFIHFPECREFMTVVHFNHDLRGEDSRADEAFVRRLANALGLQFLHGEGSGEVSDEAGLRKERLAFLGRVSKDCDAKVILQGHQRDDVAETLLWRLARGAGLAGLAAPRPVRHAREITFVRPLLSISRDDIRRLLLESGASWREDVTNVSRDYLRNRLRSRTMVAWGEDVGRDVTSGASRSRRLLQEADEALEDWGREVLANSRGGQELRVPVLSRLPVAVCRKVVARWLNEISPDSFPDAKNLDLLLAALSVRKPLKISVTTNKWLVADGDTLRIQVEHEEIPSWQSVFLPKGARLFLPEGGCLYFDPKKPSDERISAVVEGHANPHEETFLSLDALFQERLLVRKRLAGDRFRPLGSPGERKLKDLFIDHKVAVRLRDVLPVVCSCEGRILWVPGFPPAEQARVEPDSRRVIRLTYVASWA